ncbi:hypothetical protein ACFPRL_08420 [Pseudoclavibacter helvolus]
MVAHDADPARRRPDSEGLAIERGSEAVADDRRQVSAHLVTVSQAWAIGGRPVHAQGDSNKCVLNDRRNPHPQACHLVGIEATC